MVVSPSTVRSLLRPEDPGSNPVIDKHLFHCTHTYLMLTVCRKDENKEKESGNDPLKHPSFRFNFV